LENILRFHLNIANSAKLGMESMENRVAIYSLY